MCLHTDFPNIAFHKQKKDLCNFCYGYENINPDQMITHQPEFEYHQNRKIQVRELKFQHKFLFKTDSTTVAIACDLEQVFLCS